jgi:hypothetical protein
MGHFKWWGAVGALALLTHCASGTKDGADLPVADTEEEVLEKEELGQTGQALTVAPYNYSVEADATVDATQPDTSFGQGIRVTVDGSPERRGYVRFQVRGLEGRVTRATLRFFAKDPAADGPAVFSTSSTWSEDTLTWNNAPALQGSALADAGAVPDDSWVEYDVTSHVLGNGEYSFALVSGAADGTVLVSNESTLLSRRPLLSVWTDTPCEGGVTTASCSYKGDGLGGGTTLWKKVVGGPGDEYLSAMGSNGGDDFVIAGSFHGAGSTFGGGTLPGEEGIALVRYRADGSVLWRRGFNNRFLGATGVAMTSTAHSFLLGAYQGTPDLGTGPLPEAASPLLSNMYLAKFGPDGRPLWSRGFGAWRVVESNREPSNINPLAVAADARGHVVVMGIFSGYVDFGGGTLFSGANPTGGDELAGTFVVKFSGDGKHLWSKALPSSSTQSTRSFSLAVDEQGHVLVGGAVARGADLGDGPVQNVSSYAPFVVKFSPEGTWGWKRVLVGATGAVQALAASGGDVFFTGQFTRSFTFAGQTHAQDAYEDIFLGSLGPSGEERWMRQLGTAAADHAQRLVVTSTGAVVLGGFSAWQTDLGGGVLRSGPFLASYLQEDGSHRWSRNLSTLSIHHELCAVGPGEVVYGNSFANTVRIDGEPFTASGSDLMLLKLRP